MYKYLLIIWLVAACAFTATAQKPDTTSKSVVKKSLKDTTAPARHDTVAARSFIPKPAKEKVYHPDTNHSPHKAIMRSLMIPGWGQIYNHRWWKVPVIYTGLTLLGVAIVYNNTYYTEFLALSKYREFGTTPAPTDKYYTQAILYQSLASQALYDATDSYRRDRDLCILGVFGAWGINVIDAYIDAKFIHSYSVDNNLSMKISPGLLDQQMFEQNSAGSYIPGIKITFTF